jgi:TonB family protein
MAEPLVDLNTLERPFQITLNQWSRDYPVELRHAGVQGDVLVVMSIKDGGRSERASLGRSSGSPQLDKIAVKLVQMSPFQAKSAEEKGLKAIVVPVHFYKDDLDGLLSKTCEDFNVDHAYFKATFPERSPEEMRVFEVAASRLALSNGTQSLESLYVARPVEIFPAATQPTIEACKSNPGTLFYGIWSVIAKKAG